MESAPLDEKIADPRDQKKFVFHATRFRKIFLWGIRCIIWFLMKREYQGADNIPAAGPVVLASNHMTNFDVFPMQLGIPRPLFFMAKSELHEPFLMDIMLRNLGAFPVYRGQGDEWALRHAEKVLEHGQVLAIFPEGARNKGRGLRSAKTGAARFALQANCPIIPVAVEGTHQVLKTFPRRAKVKVTIGEPIYPKPGESALALTDRIMFTIAALLPRELRGVYAERAAGFEKE